MSKKYLRKNEFRLDLNSNHMGKMKKAHPAYITARQGHYFKANIITHSKNVNGVKYFVIDENPDKLSKDKRKTKISPPYWQTDKQFSNYTLNNFRFSNNTKKSIRKYNRKFRHKKNNSK